MGRHLLPLLRGILLAIGDIVLGDVVKHIGDGAAGRNGVDGDFFRATILGEDADEGVDGALGAGVKGVGGDAEVLGGVGGHEDDAAAVAQVAVGFAGDEELAARVEAEDAVELLLGDVFQVAEADDARVAADDVEAAEVGDGGVEQLDRLRDLADVGLEGDRVGTQAFDFGDDFFGVLGGVGVVDDDFSA